MKIKLPYINPHCPQRHELQEQPAQLSGWGQRSRLTILDGSEQKCTLYELPERFQTAARVRAEPGAASEPSSIPRVSGILVSLAPLPHPSLAVRLVELLNLSGPHKLLTNSGDNTSLSWVF